MKRTIALGGLMLPGLLLGTSASAGAQTRSPRARRPLVEVSHKGYTTKRTMFGREANFGVILRDRSRHLAAVGVRVTVQFRGKGKPWKPTAYLLTGIPAGGTFYFSGEALGGAKPTSMRVRIQLEHTSGARLVLPPVRTVHLSGSLLPHATGRFGNPYARSSAEQEWMLNQGGILYVVYFGRHGKILGGSQVNLDSLDAFPRPGTVAPFSVAAAAPRGTARVAASIDPCDNTLGLSAQCVALR